MFEFGPSPRPEEPASEEQLLEYVRALVRDGVCNPGDIVRIESLTSQEIDRRLALRVLNRLEEEEVVEPIRQLGMAVSGLSVRERFETLALSAALDAEMAAMAAVRRSERHMRELWLIHCKIEALLADCETSRLQLIDSYRGLNRAFHRLINACVGSESIAQRVNALTIRCECALLTKGTADGSRGSDWMFTIFAPENLQSSSVEHFELLRAMGNKDAVAAFAASRNHCRETARRLRTAISFAPN